MIKLTNNGNCVFPNDNNELISGNCNSNSDKYIYEMKRLIQNILKNHCQVK